MTRLALAKELTCWAFVMISLGLAGCGGRSYIIFDSPKDPLDHSGTVRIGEIEDRVPEQDLDKHPTAEATQALRGALADRLEREGVFGRAEVDYLNPDAADYEITGHILSYDPPKESSVFLNVLSFLVYGPWGLPAGEDGRLWVNLTLQDQGTGRVLYSGNFLGHAKNPVKAVAKDFTKELKNRSRL